MSKDQKLTEIAAWVEIEQMNKWFKHLGRGVNKLISAGPKPVDQQISFESNFEPTSIEAWVIIDGKLRHAPLSLNIVGKILLGPNGIPMTLNEEETAH